MAAVVVDALNSTVVVISGRAWVAFVLDSVTVSEVRPDSASVSELCSWLLGSMSIDASSLGVNSRYDGLGLLPVEKFPGEAGGVKLNILGGNAI